MWTRRSCGIWGASRHAFTVGFVSVMVFSIGQRLGSEIVADQHYAAWAWLVLPVSAVVEMTAVTGFAIKLLVTVSRT